MTSANPVTLPLSGYAAQHVQLAVAGAVATITLNRPERKNPLTFESHAAIEAEAVAQALCMETEDFVRAYRAFADKPKPEFEGN